MSYETLDLAALKTELDDLREEFDDFETTADEIKAGRLELAEENEEDTAELDACEFMEGWVYEAYLAHCALNESEPWTEDSQDRLDALVELENEIGEHDDWKDGVNAIPASGMAEYAQEFAHDTGAMDTSDATWPFNHLDWDAAGEELAEGMTMFSFEDDDYYIRN